MRIYEKIIKFEPYPNKFSIVKKFISFNIMGDFHITDPKNIATFILKSSFKAIDKIRVYINSKFKINSSLYYKINILLKSKNNFDFYSVSTLKQKLKAHTFPNKIKFISDNIKSVLNIIVKPIKLKLKFNSISAPTLKIKTTSKDNRLILSDLSILNFNETIKSKSNFELNNFTRSKSKYFTKSNSNLKIISISKIKEKMILKPSNGSLSLNGNSNATVYRPTKLYVLYPQIIGDWYDKTIEEIFFGTELV